MLVGRGDLYSRTFNHVCQKANISLFLTSETISHLRRKYIAYRRYISLSPAGEIPFGKNKFMDKTIRELAVELTIEITAICDSIKGRAVFVNQLLRSCSSIGANSYEAKYAQSTADFVNKLEIALKECYETDYWLEIFLRLIQWMKIHTKCFPTNAGQYVESSLPPLPPQRQKKANKSDFIRNMVNTPRGLNE